MKETMKVLVLVTALAMLGAPAAQAFENFDSYNLGDNVQTAAPAVWAEWYGAIVTDTVSMSGPYSATPNDLYRTGTAHRFGAPMTDVIVSAQLWGNLAGANGDSFRLWHIGVALGDPFGGGGVYIYHVDYSSPGWGGNYGYISQTEPAGGGASTAHNTGVPMGSTWTSVEFRVSSATGTELWMNGGLIASDPLTTSIDSMSIFFDPFDNTTAPTTIERLYVDDIMVRPIPEPSALLALATGLVAVGGFIRRRK